MESEKTQASGFIVPPIGAIPPDLVADRTEAETRLQHRLPSSRHAWWSVAVLTGLYALSLMDRQIISLVVNDIRRDLGITDFAVGLLSGVAFALFYVSFGLLFGWAMTGEAPFQRPLRPTTPNAPRALC